MGTLASHGLGFAAPGGWEGRIFRRAEAGEVQAADVPGPSAPPGERSFPVVHAATIPIPADAADYGSDLVADLGPDDAFVVVKEFDPADAGQPLFAARTGIPREVSPADFSPSMLQRALEGQGGVQVFCNEAGRAFCLYVVLGSYDKRHTTVPRVNEVLATIHVDPLEP